MDGKNNLMLLIASFALGILMAGAIGFSVFKASDSIKISLVNNEINTIKTAAITSYLPKSSDGTFTGISNTDITSIIPGLTINAGKLVSKVNSTINYVVTAKTGDSTQLEITASGLTALTDLETSVKNTQTGIATSVTDTTAGDGILVLAYKG